MKRGFSLVELSIVLVILGLLTGGILAGQSLIRAAELRSVGTQLQAYTLALQSFRGKYHAIPGDMANATSFFGNASTGTAGGECADNATATGTYPQTCNGDGDGRIAQQAAEDYEMFRVWQHLAAAGLVEGSYTGVTGSGGTGHALIGTNVPELKIKNAGVTLFSIGTRLSGDTLYYAGEYGNALEAGAQPSTTITHHGFLRPEEAWNLDTKADDGRPGTGGILVREQKVPDCATSTDPATATYAVTITDYECNLIYKTGL